MELLKSMASTDLLPVPCKRGGAAAEFLTRSIQIERIKWAEVVKRAGRR
jgi:hypothetical protein